jgi:transcription initiation factor TFIID subunit 6
MQAATRATLIDLVGRHVSSLIRESAVVNRHSKRGGCVSAAGEDVDVEQRRDDADHHGDDDDGGGGGGPKRRRIRRMIHHDDVNLALSWRGSEKLYVSGVPMAAAAPSPDDDNDDNDDRRRRGGSRNDVDARVGGGLGRLLRVTDADLDDPAALLPSLLSSLTVPRLDLNAYLRSELVVDPPHELGLTLHWLAVDGVSPAIPQYEVWNATNATRPAIAVPPLPLDVSDDDDDEEEEDGHGRRGRRGGDGDEDEDGSSIRIRELRHRLLSEELLLYYERVTSTVSGIASMDAPAVTDDVALASVLNGLRRDPGLQELVPFLSRYVASGLMLRRNLRDPDRCRRLVRVFDAVLDNPTLHLDLHLHQMFVPVGTCIVARNLSSSSSSSSSKKKKKKEKERMMYQNGDHWSLREEAARASVKACNAYGDQYATARPRVIGLLMRQALRPDRPLPTQYGGMVGISLFGPRAIDAFLLPIAREYWEHWEGELRADFNDDDDDDADDDANADDAGGGGGTSGRRRRRRRKVCVLTWPPEGEGRLSIIGTTKSPDLYPPPPRHLITKLKGSTESHFCIPRFPPSRLASLLSEVNRGGGTAAARGR